MLSKASEAKWIKGIPKNIRLSNNWLIDIEIGHGFKITIQCLRSVRLCKLYV